MTYHPAPTSRDQVFEVPAQPFEIPSFLESLEAEFPDIPGETLAAAAYQAARSGVSMTEENAFKAAVRSLVMRQGLQ